MYKTYSKRIILLLLLVGLAFLSSPLSGQTQAEVILSQLINNPNGLEAERAVRELRTYSPADIKVAARGQLADVLLQDRFPHLDQFFLLAGYLKMDDALRNVAVENRSTEKLKRAYGLALVRAGDLIKTEELLKSIRALPYDDQFIYDLLPFLIYTHNRDIYDYLIELILEPSFNCEPADAHATGSIDCGYRLMEAFAPVLIDYPFEIGLSGDLKVDDYPAALQEIRSWFERYQNDYEIVTNQY